MGIFLWNESQFHYGSIEIEQKQLLEKPEQFYSLNSIMVRLK